MKYKRILLKLSGESLMGEKQYGIDETRLPICQTNQRSGPTRSGNGYRYRRRKYFSWT